MMVSHVSVLVEEALEFLAPRSGQILVDGTLGLAGHAARIIERLGPSGRLIGFDRDEAALNRAKEVLGRWGGRVLMIQDNFKNIPARLVENGIPAVDGFLLDLGVSSLQLEDAERGFSFQRGGALDMRMDRRQALAAERIVNEYPVDRLEEILREFGEERYARGIARKIVEARRARRIRTTGELAGLIREAVPASYRHGRLDPATRSFQALRITVNDELGSLQSLLNDLPHFLKEGARVVIISFHSLEDRAVKLAFRRYEKEGLGKILTKKPIVPTQAEIAHNPRARSAKLRAFLKEERAVA